MLENRTSRFGRVDHRGPQALRLHHSLERFARRRVIVHHQHVASPQIIGRRGGGGRGDRHIVQQDRESRGEVERAPGPRLAFDPDLPAHEPRQLGRDRQPQTGAFEAARERAVGLGEGLEDRLAFGARDANAGVRDGELQDEAFGVPGSHRDSGGDFAAVGELDGVADQVDQNLPKPVGVPDQSIGHVGLDEGHHLQTLGMGAQGQAFHHGVHPVAQAELRLLQVQPPGFDARKVQDVVEQGEQSVGRRLHGLQIGPLLGDQVRVQHQLRHAGDAVDRRADLVTHRRQELALGPAGPLRLSGHLVGSVGLALEAPIRLHQLSIAMLDCIHGPAHRLLRPPSLDVLAGDGFVGPDEVPLASRRLPGQPLRGLGHEPDQERRQHRDQSDVDARLERASVGIEGDQDGLPGHVGHGDEDEEIPDQPEQGDHRFQRPTGVAFGRCGAIGGRTHVVCSGPVHGSQSPGGWRESCSAAVATDSRHGSPRTRRSFYPRRRLGDGESVCP